MSNEKAMYAAGEAHGAPVATADPLPPRIRARVWEKYRKYLTGAVRVTSDALDPAECSHQFLETEDVREGNLLSHRARCENCDTVGPQGNTPADALTRYRLAFQTWNMPRVECAPVRWVYSYGHPPRECVIRSYRDANFGRPGPDLYEYGVEYLDGQKPETARIDAKSFNRYARKVRPVDPETPAFVTRPTCDEAARNLLREIANAEPEQEGA